MKTDDTGVTRKEQEFKSVNARVCFLSFVYFLFGVGLFKRTVEQKKKST